MALADTSFLIDLLTGHPEAAAKLDELVAIGEPVWVPSISLQELYYGAHLHAESEQEVQRVRELERALPPVGFDAEAARRAGALEAKHEQDGERLGRADLQIAACALARGESVVSRDEAFSKVEGLPVDPY